ncbi:hypothetical protein GSY69_12540 [Brevibacterium sp. 5221]|uniref:DUF4232 domain-containing protein n=1 Tax=Brevibacterium rongguiense TaxID=2695267 RepID=A0A6N9H9V2_9MICO|nr:hypothetical protein [Brevibacterium rongguiense]MYM20765.1 hypothetical protein [Brevibacterium rongguiense]
MSPSTYDRRPAAPHSGGQRGLSAHRRLPAEVYRRRRLTVLGLAVVVIVLFIIGIVLLAQALSGGRAQPAAQSGGGDEPAPAAATTQSAAGPTDAEASGSCPADSISVTAKTDKKAYQAGDSAKLQLTVKNGNDKDCSIEVGSAAQNYIVQRDGKTVWASQYCAAGGAKDVKNFAAGSEKKATVAWDMVPADDTCKKTADALEPGTYQLITQLGKVKSQAADFTVEGDAKPTASATTKKD